MPGSRTAAASRSTGSTPRRCSAAPRPPARRALDGILIPGGFGSRGFEGKIEAARFARENGVPYLGICFGHARRRLRVRTPRAGMEGANSTECDPETPLPVIDLLPEQKEIVDLGGTMRLGATPIKLHEGTRARELYDYAVIHERHRHRYEVNNMLRRRLEAAGLVMSGTTPDERLVEIVELTDHPFYVASQFHPEFKSRPERPAPLFREFVAAALARSRAASDRVGARRRATAKVGAHRGVTARRPSRSSAADRELAALCRIDEPLGRADAPMGAELRALGLEVAEDGAGAAIGATAATCSRAFRERRPARPVRCAPGHRSSGRRDRAGARRRRLGERQRRDSRR